MGLVQLQAPVPLGRSLLFGVGQKGNVPLEDGGTLRLFEFGALRIGYLQYRSKQLSLQCFEAFFGAAQ